MKLPVYKFVAVCCCLVLFGSCKKNDDESPRSQKLRAGKWKIAASAQTWKHMGADTTIDYYRQWRPCEQDDLLLFYENGDGAHDENRDKCPEDNQSDLFKWSLHENDSKLHIVIGGKAMVFEIIELTDVRLTLRYVEDDLKLGSVTYVETHTNIK